MISVADLRRAALVAKKDKRTAAPLAASVTLSPNAETATTTPTPAPASSQRSSRHVFTYRHDPYSYCAIASVSNKLSAEESFFECYGGSTAPSLHEALSSSSSVVAVEPVMSSDGFALPIPASKARAAHKQQLLQVEPPRHHSTKALRDNLELSSTNHDDGVSEVSSENGASHPTLGLKQPPQPFADKTDSSHMQTPAQDGLLTPDEESGLSPVPNAPHARQPDGATTETSLTVTAAPLRLPSIIRYASVNFRFGSAWFIAPFKTSVGDLVVVEYPANNSLHMGLVAAITTEKPSTFYSAENPNPDTLTDEEVALLPRLLRHARDFDKDTKLDLRNHDLRSLRSAQLLAKEMGVAMRFHDAEWLLDLSAVTFLVSVYEEDVRLVHELADELASVEGAEVVFNYPSVQQQAYF